MAVEGRRFAFYAASLIVAVLMAAASVVGLAAGIYTTPELYNSFAPNDVVNLVIGLPLLLGSLWAAWRGSYLGLLFWPGALVYVIYTYLVYLLAMPFGGLTLLYAALVIVSLYTLIGLAASLEPQTAADRLAPALAARFAGAVLALLGAFFIGRGAQLAIAEGTGLPLTEQALLIADFFLGSAWLLGGVLLFQRRPFAYALGPGLLLQAVALFAGAVVLLLLQPALTGLPFQPESVVVLSVMSLTCVIPFVRLVVGAAGNRLRRVQ